jgi:hypothetical protein
MANPKNRVSGPGSPAAVAPRTPGRTEPTFSAPEPTMSTESAHPAHEAKPATAKPSRPPVNVGTRQPLRFTIPPGIIDRLARGRGRTLRRLTPIKSGSPRESLDPVVQRALEDLETKYTKSKKDNEEYLADNYLEEAEAVTASLNRHALPAMTRALLAADGVYEHFLVAAVRRVVEEPGSPTTHTR